MVSRELRCPACGAGPSYLIQTQKDLWYCTVCSECFDTREGYGLRLLGKVSAKLSKRKKKDVLTKAFSHAVPRLLAVSKSSSLLTKAPKLLKVINLFI